MKVLNRVRDSRPTQAAATLLITAAVVLGLPSLAYASTTPSVENSINSGFSSLQSLIVGVLAAALFAITVAALGIKMGVRWLRKGSSS